MKKFFYLLASAALLLGACTKDEDPSLKVSPESLAFDGSASSKNVTIESNTAWEITGVKDWVSINKTSGNGNETIIVTVLENDGLDRECTVNISSSAAPATIKISQTGRPNLNVSEKDLEFGSEAGEKEVTVKTNKDWTVQNNCDWITVTPSSGKASDSEQTVKIAVAANTESERTGELTFAIDAETSVKVSVRQEGSVLEYAGVKYRTVKMKDGRTWMAENLRYVPEGKTPSSDPTDENGVWNPVGDDGKPTTDPAAIAEKGYLYDYPTVLKSKVTKDNFKTFEGKQGICPDGWHIPTRAEFVALCGYSNKGEGENAPKVDKDAAYYDEAYNGGKIVTLDTDGFGWAFAGIINRSSDNATGKYIATMTTKTNCSVEDYIGKPSVNYLISSTGYGINKTNSYIQFFAMMSAFSSQYKEGRATVAFTGYLGGQPLRCIKNK